MLIKTLGLFVVIGILVMVIAKRSKGATHEEDKADADNGMARGENSEKRGCLSPTASRALDEKMDAEDPRFEGTKYW